MRAKRQNIIMKCKHHRLKINKNYNNDCYIHVACVCTTTITCSDWLILGHYFPVMPMCQLRPVKTKQKAI